MDNLLKYKKQIKAQNPFEQKIDYNKEAWKKYFNEDKAFQRIIQKHPKSIKRKNILTNSNNIYENFLLTMIWGFGKTGYGAYRTSEMVKKTKRFNQVLNNSYDMIKNKNIENAYDCLKIFKCGPAFLTKILYFYGYNNNDIKPLILDARVAISLEELKIDIKKFGKINRSKDSKVLSFRRFSTGYLNYIEEMNNLAKKINTEPHNIEMFLFNYDN